MLNKAQLCAACPICAFLSVFVSFLLTFVSKGWIFKRRKTKAHPTSHKAQLTCAACPICAGKLIRGKNRRLGTRKITFVTHINFIIC